MDLIAGGAEGSIPLPVPGAGPPCPQPWSVGNVPDRQAKKRSGEMAVQCALFTRSSSVPVGASQYDNSEEASWQHGNVPIRGGAAWSLEAPPSPLAHWCARVLRWRRRTRERRRRSASLARVT